MTDRSGSEQFFILSLGGSEKQMLLRNTARQFHMLKIHEACSEEELHKRISSDTMELIVIDFDQPGYSPLKLIRALKEISTDVQIIGVTNGCKLSLVLNALKSGVDEVVDIEQEPEQLGHKISDLVNRWRQKRDGENLNREHQQRYDFSAIIGQSPAMRDIFARAAKIIRRPWVTVLLTGETGTGKQLFANAIHYNSFSDVRPFIEINCNALPENLLESELFGYEKGAFTDAKTQKKGLFELSKNGSLFLDEIGELSHAIQVKLLKTLEEKKSRRLGGITDVNFQSRIISATNRDLRKEIRNGRFRQDLYYRLNVVSIHLPALRDRGDDVVVLARQFLAQYAEQYESSLKEFTPQAEAFLKQYHWPGNIRELKHAVERATVLGDGRVVTQQMLEDTIDSEMPLIMSTAQNELKINLPSKGISLDDGEKWILLAVLNKTGWHKQQACDILGISRPRLNRKINKYGLERISR